MHQEVLDHIEEGHLLMDESLEHLEKELHKIRAGRATPAILSGVMVDYYGSQTPLTQVSNISATDSRTLTIAPWEKGMIQAIETAITHANLGLNPQNNGEQVILNIPPLTEERRIDFVKRAKNLGEEAKISLRNARHKIMDFIKKAVKEGYPEDEGKRREESAQKMVNGFNDKIDQMVDKKEKDIMTI